MRVPLTRWVRGRAIGRDRLGRDASGWISGAETTWRPGCQEWIIAPPSPCCSPGPQDVSIGDWVASLSCPRARYATIPDHTPTERVPPVHPQASRAYLQRTGVRGKHRRRARLGDAITGEESQRAINDRDGVCKMGRRWRVAVAALPVSA